MDNHNLYKRIEQHVKNLFADNNNAALVFHNLKHTQTVVSRTEEIAAHYNLSNQDMLVLFVAAWFHDTGHLFTEPVGHEAKSVEIMRKFMTANMVDEALIKNIGECIMATQMPRNPATLLQEIIC